MAKNLVKNNKQPKAMEAIAPRDMEALAASGNLEAGAAYEAPMKSNAKRLQPHLGQMPASGQGKF